jgi:hypothetical protein
MLIMVRVEKISPYYFDDRTGFIVPDVMLKEAPAKAPYYNIVIYFYFYKITLMRAVRGLSKGKIVTRRDEGHEGKALYSFASFVPSCYKMHSPDR